ncbi:hypothetical protein NA57DRAFT_41916 [Rhizodiscina lignyota]|uniref:Mitochondrial escape protein 2 n=1 Tax=Rhizodiscina lignyota TaxID=1504668 RepID=A0A9P4IB83_9PEZI|nr:hypothetical protein NA57DRAFT_41916 [Rhizodiscina lignyota]
MKAFCSSIVSINVLYVIVNLTWYTAVFPLRLRWLFRLPFQETKLDSLTKQLERPAIAGVDPLDVISKVNLERANFDVVELLPRLKEGGAFVKFTHNQNVSLETIETAVKAYLKETRPHPWWAPFTRMRANRVQGKPWVEDLYSRLPSTRVKVEFLPPNPGETAAELSEEQLYSFFRRYGKLANIVPQPSDSKVLPRFAYVDFTAIRRAIMAKNCMHGYLVSEAEGGGKTGTVLRLSYEAKVKAHWIRDWIFGHPRIVIPALIAIAGAITVAVFDPIRTFFIKAHILGTFHITNNRIWRWFRAQAADLFTFRRRRDEDAGMQAIWSERNEDIEKIRTWLMETADTFIIVQGPRGSGKRELVLDQALKTRKLKLVIDCKPIQEARGDSATICAAAAEVGYRPVFSWMNSISGMIDLAAQGAAGVKTGFSETLDSQLAKIWNNTATALKQIALEGRSKDDKDAHMSEDEYLEAHPEKRPVVVIDNFLHKAQESNVVYDKISEWAARLTTANIAHVIFLTNDVSFSKSLSKALPDRVFRQISLGDCSPEAAKRFVISHLDADPAEAEAEVDGEKKLTPSQRRKDLVELDECINVLGGRLTDLEFLARRIKTGETPKRAVAQIVEQSASEIMKMYIFGMDDATRKWGPEQAWHLIRQLAQQDALRYNEVLLSSPFSSNGDAVLQALEQAELISIVSTNGRPQAIKPGKPVFQPAFRMLTEDRVLKARLDLAILSDQIKSENASIDKCENELKLLGELPRRPSEISGRIVWLLGKLKASQEKVEAFEMESAGLKKILQQEY